MKFGTFKLDEAEGTILAHSVATPEKRLPKGHALRDDDIALLKACGKDSVIAARLDEGDLLEDEAARQLAAAIPADHLRFSDASTGRVNIYATSDGLFIADREIVDSFNRIDPAITLACLADHVPVRTGDMVATIKIIPLAVAGGAVRDAAAMLEAVRPFEVKPFQPCAVSLIATQLPALKPSVMDKTQRVLATRLSRYESRIIGEKRVDHDTDAVAEAIRASLYDLPGKGMIVIFGASAMADFDDVIPAAIRMAGGRVEHAGMPVDPGNLLVLGWIGEIPVIGAPGCARSSKENGFDWILNRLLAGERPSSRDITGMGVGGLLMEIPSRPQLRETTASRNEEISIGVVVLAAGSASRMGADGHHKLLAEFAGEPLVRRSARTARTVSDAAVVVTGYRQQEITAALTGLDVQILFNADFASGMASSLITGISAPGMREKDGILIILADMPGVTSDDLRRLNDAFREAGGRAIVRAVANGKRGNPVILPRAAYPDLLKLEGDIGARHIIETCGLPVLDVEIGEAAHLDVDTPEAVLAAGGVLKG